MKLNPRLLVSALVLGMTIPLSASATIGYFAHGYGTKNKGAAGAGVANATDSLSAATNPASMVFVGNRLDVGAAIFSPRRKYTVTGTPNPPPAFGLTEESVRSDSDYFLVPSFGTNWMLGDDSSVGISVYGNGGMNTDYPATPNGGLGTYASGQIPGAKPETGVNLSQLFFNFSYARKINDKSSWGVGLIAAYQEFEATGLASFGGFSSNPAALTDNGKDSATGFGVKLGWQGDVNEDLTLGLSYQSKIEMSEFDDYAGLFAEQGGFDIPATFTVGMAAKILPNHKLLLDFQKIYFSQVNSIANPLLPNLMTSQLGNVDGAGFGWNDIIILKLGYEFAGENGWLWRWGYSVNENPIPNSETLFNILAPAVMTTHVTFGFTKTLASGNELNFAAMWAPTSTVTGPNQLNGPGQDITLEMRQYEIEASYGWKF